jgi:hypothetical protein
MMDHHMARPQQKAKRAVKDEQRFDAWIAVGSAGFPVMAEPAAASNPGLHQRWIFRSDAKAVGRNRGSETTDGSTTARSRIVGSQRARRRYTI